MQRHDVGAAPRSYAGAVSAAGSYTGAVSVAPVQQQQRGPGFPNVPHGASQPPPPPPPPIAVRALPQHLEVQYQPQGVAGEVGKAVGRLHKLLDGAGENVLLAAGSNLSGNALRWTMMSAETQSPPFGFEANPFVPLPPASAGAQPATSEADRFQLSEQAFNSPADILTSFKRHYDLYHAGQAGIKIEHKCGGSLDVVCSNIESVAEFRRREQQHKATEGARASSGADADVPGPAAFERITTERCELRIPFRKGASGKWHTARVQDGPVRGSNEAVWHHSAECSVYGRDDIVLSKEEVVNNTAALDLIKAVPDVSAKRVIDTVLVRSSRHPLWAKPFLICVGELGPTFVAHSLLFFTRL